MPECRRDQTKFAIFLLVMVSVETVLIFTIMHIEHKAAERQAEMKRLRRRLSRSGKLSQSMAQSLHHKLPVQNTLRPQFRLENGKELTKLTQYDLTWNPKTHRYHVVDAIEGADSNRPGKLEKTANEVPPFSKNHDSDLRNIGEEVDYDYDYKDYVDIARKDGEPESIILSAVKSRPRIMTVRDRNIL